jgi:hypothetical protein
MIDVMNQAFDGLVTCYTHTDFESDQWLMTRFAINDSLGAFE